MAAISCLAGTAVDLRQLHSTLHQFSACPSSHCSFWPAFEEYLTREDVNESVLDINRVKARVQNVSTSITHDLTFTLTPNEVANAFLPKWQPLLLLSRSGINHGAFSLSQTPQGLGDSMGWPHCQSAEDQTGTMLDNVMVSVKVGGRQIAGLSHCVELSFSHGRLPQNVFSKCVFWDTKKGWNTSGCVTVLRDKETMCCCDHLTFFTLLMSPSLDVTVQMLLTIANVGCGISVVFSALTIILYFVLRFAYKKFKSNDTAKIHVNLTSSLLLLNLAYLLNRRIFSMGHLGLCKGIGGFTHYCLLCCFTWMAIEAFQLYLLVIKVTNIYMRHYMVKLCLVGWGFPALVVTITGSMNSYGKYTITNMANQPTITLCWIDSAHLVVHYVTNCSYFGLILLFNTLILVVVAWKLFCLQRATAGKEEKLEAWKGGLTVLGLSCLLGATWGLAFFTYGATSVPAVYLFTVLNSLQGLFIFIWFTVLYYPKKDAATSTSSSGKNVEDTTASHSER
uniref:Adhesion G protein-coupled receptor G3 n=1 Tax=Chelonoidis abingdonii TaxID=106734 RepID=A0A8C0QQK5_CHEAB